MGGGDSSQLDVRPRGLLVQPQNQNIQGSERGDVQHSASGGCAKYRTTDNQTSFFYCKKFLSGFDVVAIKLKHILAQSWLSAVVRC